MVLESLVSNTPNLFELTLSIVSLLAEQMCGSINEKNNDGVLCIAECIAVYFHVRFQVEKRASFG